MKKLFNIIFTLSVTAFILLAILLVISAFKLPFLPLDARSVLTGSMEPAIPTGSIVFIYPQNSYKEGDIITFRPDGSRLALPVTHRIVGALQDDNDEPYFVTMGDNNQGEDASPVYTEDIYGKVILHIPFLGRLLEFAKTPIGFAVLIIIPALLVIYDEGKKIVRIVRKEKEQSENDEEKKDVK